MALNLARRVLIGRPLPTHRLKHERLNKFQGLAVFSSDALSSSAYATEEILLALLLAGPAALAFSWPISLLISAVLAIVAFSYYQTIHAYPGGGGAYVVARANLGVWAGLIAAAALFIDYVLTVSVSISAGVAAMTSALPALLPYRVLLALLAVTVMAVLNLRGARESGTIISIPTFLFIFTVLTMLTLGLRRAWGAAPFPPQIAAEGVAPLQALSLLLLLRAFASGSAAMTGIEAIANGVPAFRPPESRNAGITLIWMATILASFFLGITFLARHFGIVPLEHETVVSQLGRAIYGTGFLYYLTQAATAMILILAANTSFAGFPRLASILAQDRFLPHQLYNLGDRLVYANGIILLALTSGVLVYLFRADTHSLIPLYAIGVFLSFTLSQSGMVRKWWRERGRGWRRSLVFNLLGAGATAVVLIVVTVAKFSGGAWIVAVMVPVLVWVMRTIWLHYRDVRRQLILAGVEVPTVVQQHKVVVPVGGMHRGVLPALRYAKSLGGDVTAVIVDVDPAETAEVVKRWERWGMGIPLKVLESPYRSLLAPLLRYLDDLEWEVSFDQQLTVVLPEFVPSRWWQFLLHNQNAFLLKAALFFRRRAGHRVTVVTDVAYYLTEERSAEPLRPGAARTHLDRQVISAVAVFALSAGGLLLATVQGWALLAQEIFGIATLLALGLLMLLLFFRGLRV
ncbi:MAG: APC family permease [bacterium]